MFGNFFKQILLGKHKWERLWYGKARKFWLHAIAQVKKLSMWSLSLLIFLLHDYT